MANYSERVWKEVFVSKRIMEMRALSCAEQGIIKYKLLVWRNFRTVYTLFKTIS
jgi:hypothetical protein